MERRWTTRTEMNIDIDVATSDAILSGCETRDIGLGGVYVLTNGQALTEGQEVELTFKLKEQLEDNAAPMIRARVVRLTNDGAGMMFKDFDAIAFRSLQKVIKAIGPKSEEPIEAPVIN